ncbi:MAG: hypothetical protein AAF591_17040 [Verrucomicrobiota bacterium]
MKQTGRTLLGVLLAVVGLLVVLPSGCDRAGAPVRRDIERSIEFVAADDIGGAELILKRGATVLIGELHGTWEIPLVVASLARMAMHDGLTTVVCVELAASEQSSLDAFLNSDGGADATDALFRGPHWQHQDGRASVGMFGMLELMRRLRAGGGDIRVVAMDASLLSAGEGEGMAELANQRDREMGRNVIRARKDFPDALILALAGNVHANIKKGAPWDEGYAPMGWHVHEALPQVIGLNIETAGGESWGTRAEGTGVSSVRGEDRGDHPFVEMHVNADTGYHGRLYVGRITAAKPVLVIDGGYRDIAPESLVGGD